MSFISSFFGKSSNSSSNRKQSVLIVLSILFGYLGVDRFYGGRIGLGIVKVISLSVFGIGFIWWIVDIFLAITGKQKDCNDEYIASASGFKSVIAAIAIIAMMIFGGYFLVKDLLKYDILEKLPFKQLKSAIASGTAPASASATITSGCNFRSGPSTNNSVIRELPKGETVKLTGETSGGWTQITHKGDTGWVSTEFIGQIKN